MLKKVLIANRGEIACRIARTCKRLGVAVAGVHSTADADSLHVKAIGESIAIGGAPASESYLLIDKVIAAAKTTGADAIHPGFGFLAENATFARAVERTGLIFIGPTPETIERLGDKSAAKREADAAGVPTIPGSATPSEDAAEIANIVRNIGLPAMLKAAAGGGGKGMRAVQSFEGLEDEIASAMREAKSSFGHAALIVEKLIEHGRHIEVQIAGDGRGNVIHLFERECSLQRRHQKLIEEAPAARLPADIRSRMLAEAVRLGQRLDYRGVGTVEFIVSGDDYYFLEVNPRLQVEHPVTELVTGLDIVEIMLRIAAGDRLPVTQDDVRCRGHAVEARLCAEDATDNFMPSTGRVSYVRFPAGVRVETGIESGMDVAPYYDSMIAKLIAYGETRDDALDRLTQAIGETSIFGVTTNQAFLQALIALPETRSATFHTQLIDSRLSTLIDGVKQSPGLIFAIAACAWLVRQRQLESPDPWRSDAMTGWHMRTDGDGLSPIPLLHLEANGCSAEIRFGPRQDDGAMRIAVNDEPVHIRLDAMQPGVFLAIAGDRRDVVRVHHDREAIFVQNSAGVTSLKAVPYLNYISAAAESSGELRAPMMGMITRVNVAIGDRIRIGDVAAVMESMKMELRISSKIDGVVTAVNCKAGEMIERNAIVVVVGAE